MQVEYVSRHCHCDSLKDMNAHPFGSLLESLLLLKTCSSLLDGCHASVVGVSMRNMENRLEVAVLTD